MAPCNDLEPVLWYLVSIATRVEPHVVSHIGEFLMPGGAEIVGGMAGDRGWVCLLLAPLDTTTAIT